MNRVELVVAVVCGGDILIQFIQATTTKSMEKSQFTHNNTPSTCTPSNPILLSFTRQPQKPSHRYANIIISGPDHSRGDSPPRSQSLDITSDCASSPS
jgi:hypothetical protein